MKRQILFILGVCYASLIFALATGGKIDSFNRDCPVERIKDSVEREDQGGDGYSQRLPRSERAPKAEQQFGWRPEYIHGAAPQDSAEAVDLPPNCAVLWTADWCKGCKEMYPVAKKLKEEGYAVYIIDFDEHQDLAKELNITKLPTTVIFEDSKLKSRHVGAVLIDKIKEDLKKNTEIDYVIW